MYDRGNIHLLKTCTTHTLNPHRHPHDSCLKHLQMDHNSMLQGSSRPRSLREVKGAIGLANTGNSCYVNATIQALSNW